jgi:hypothetical protein
MNMTFLHGIFFTFYTDATSGLHIHSAEYGVDFLPIKL